MNNRQKAKHYKRLYEQSKDSFNKPTIPLVNTKVERFAYHERVPVSIVTESSLCPDERTPMAYYTDHMAREIGHKVLSVCGVHYEPNGLPDSYDFVCDFSLVIEKKD